MGILKDESMKKFHLITSQIVHVIGMSDQKLVAEVAQIYWAWPGMCSVGNNCFAFSNCVYLALEVVGVGMDAIVA